MYDSKALINYLEMQYVKAIEKKNFFEANLVEKELVEALKLDGYPTESAQAYVTGFQEAFDFDNRVEYLIWQAKRPSGNQKAKYAVDDILEGYCKALEKRYYATAIKYQKLIENWCDHPITRLRLLSLHFPKMSDDQYKEYRFYSFLLVREIS